jgi:hypothetical protein
LIKVKKLGYWCSIIVSLHLSPRGKQLLAREKEKIYHLVLCELKQYLPYSGMLLNCCNAVYNYDTNPAHRRLKTFTNWCGVL